jgi:hypothetical protein
MIAARSMTAAWTPLTQRCGLVDTRGGGAHGFCQTMADSLTLKHRGRLPRNRYIVAPTAACIILLAVRIFATRLRRKPRGAMLRMATRMVMDRIGCNLLMIADTKHKPT